MNDVDHDNECVCVICNSYRRSQIEPSDLIRSHTDPDGYPPVFLNLEKSHICGLFKQTDIALFIGERDRDAIYVFSVSHSKLRIVSSGRVIKI